MIDEIAPTDLITPRELAAATNRHPKSIRAWLRRNADKIDASFQPKKHRFNRDYLPTLIEMINPSPTATS